MGLKMTLLESLAVATFLIVHISALIGIYINLSSKIADNTKDILNMRKDFEEHKVHNDRDFIEIKDLLKDESEKSTKGYEKILDMVDLLKESLNAVKIEIIKTIKAQ